MQDQEERTFSFFNVHSMPFFDKAQHCIHNKRNALKGPIHYHSITEKVLFKEVLKDECETRKQ